MRKKHPEHVNHERWLISYADFITLLFAFFVIMYAISQADLTKFKQVSASLQRAFSSAGPAGMVDLGGHAGGATASPFETPQITGGRVLDMPAGKTNTSASADPELQNTKELLEESISLEMGVTDISDQLKMDYDSRGLVIRIAAKDFFEPGRADVRPDFRPLLDNIGRVLAKTKRFLRVEGHTDPSEANAQGFASDWELSTARAGWVVKYWLSRFDLNPERIGVAGYGHFRPLTKNRSAWGKATNRRIEIIILNQPSS